MKRIIALLTAALLCLCACGEPTEMEPEGEAAGVVLNVVTSFGSDDGNRRNYEACLLYTSDAADD